MLYSFVFVGDRERKDVLKNLTSKINLSSSAYQVLFLTNKKQKNENLSDQFRHTNFKTIVFKENSTNEQMFETLIKSKENLGTIILFKETAKSINFLDVNRMIEQNQHGAKIVVSKQNKNQNFFNKIFSSVKSFFAKICLGLKLYPGEADIILIDTILVTTLSEMNGKTALLTKINGWAGVEPKVVTIDEQENIKNKNSKKVFTPCYVWGGLFVGMVIGIILLVVLKANMPFLGWFAYVITQLAILGIFVYSLTKAMFKYKYGNLVYTPETEIVEIIDNLDE